MTSRAAELGLPSAVRQTHCPVAFPTGYGAPMSAAGRWSIIGSATRAWRYRSRAVVVGGLLLLRLAPRSGRSRNAERAELADERLPGFRFDQEPTGLIVGGHR
jgi:hypothetical protein